MPKSLAQKKISKLMPEARKGYERAEKAEKELRQEAKKDKSVSSAEFVEAAKKIAKRRLK